MAPFLASALGLPFLVIALAERESVTAVLLAALAPAAAGAGLAVRSSRQAKTYSAAGEALAGTLVAHTARGERARIARELHDVVAHHISMIAVLAETGRLTTPGLPEAGARRFAEIGDTARGGLTEMRRLLGVLREDAADAEPAAEPAAEAGGSGLAAEAGGSGPAPRAVAASRHPQPGLAQLAELTDAAREASGGTARLIISGPVAPLDPGVELAAYRIVQEALTNARRHAAGAAIDVELRYAPDVLRLRVRDNGPGPGPAPNSDGHGLLGMRERAFSVGGSLYTGAAAGGGFLVEAVLPGARDAERSERDGTASGASAAGTSERGERSTGGRRMSETIGIVVADDHEVVRAGFAALLATQPDFAVLGTARDGGEAVRACRELRPDVVLMDVRMPGTDGIEATRQLTGGTGATDGGSGDGGRAPALRRRCSS